MFMYFPISTGVISVFALTSLHLVGETTHDGTQPLPTCRSLAERSDAVTCFAFHEKKRGVPTD